ncbi:hypothetical protein SAMN04488121_11243 [Chitinophaga filiformis]|uniref:Uncharacterized protein n=1 Tax=Chitinophaga filiformis TaxID=104663 RepID=A0A1G8C7J9_CHIFI|nr:hypothetical protein SAMN04488121_11243 [Chitinophaga filiformis]
MLSNAPKTKVDFQHVAADGDLVFLHVKAQNLDGKDMALVDIFRLSSSSPFISPVRVILLQCPTLL